MSSDKNVILGAIQSAGMYSTYCLQVPSQGSLTPSLLCRVPLRQSTFALLSIKYINHPNIYPLPNCIHASSTSDLSSTNHISFIMSQFSIVSLSFSVINAVTSATDRCSVTCVAQKISTSICHKATFHVPCFILLSVVVLFPFQLWLLHYTM